jgi:DNA invertase Pin-like site-specific DNA recombinase
MQEFIGYRRISNSERGRSGLGLESQAAAILQFVTSRGGVLLQDFVEREPGKGSNALDRRPQLQEAMKAAQKRRAVLVVSRLDRLSRDVRLLSGLIESGVEFVAAETPDADATMLHIYATVAQETRGHVARRVSAALQAKKRVALAQGRANPLGNVASLQPRNKQRSESAAAFAARLAPTLEAYRSAGMPQRRMVEELNRQGIRTAGGGTWSLMQLQRVLARLPTTVRTAP